MAKALEQYTAIRADHFKRKAWPKGLLIMIELEAIPCCPYTDWLDQPCDVIAGL